jgi:hypothetical protein
MRHLMQSIVSTHNMTPTYRSSPLTPQEIMSGIKPDMKKDLRSPFGTFAVFHNPTKMTDEDPRGEVGIVLGRDFWSQGSVFAYLVDSEEVVSRAHFKTIKPTQALIDRVNSLTPAGAAVRPTITLPGGRGRDDEVPNAIPPAARPSPLVTHRPVNGPSSATAPPPPPAAPRPPVTPSPPPPSRPLTPSPPPVVPYPPVTQAPPDAAQGTAGAEVSGSCSVGTVESTSGVILR